MWRRKMSRWDRIEGRLHRAFEIVLGLVLAVGTIVPLAVAVGAAHSVVSGDDELGLGWAAFILVTMGGLAYWTALLAWRLLSRRERPGGGLFPPWLLYLAGAGASALGAARRTVWGPGFDASAEHTATEYFDLARSRRRKPRRKPKTD